MFATIREMEQLTTIGYADAGDNQRLDAYWMHPEASTTPSFDGQGSGHDSWGTLWHPSFGNTGNCDGGRSHTYCDYQTN